MSVRPKFHFLIVLLVALWVGLLAQACMPVQPESSGAGAAAPEMDTVRLVTLPFITFAPFYIAQEEGFFAEQRLNVEYVELTQQDQGMPALTSGEVDVHSGLVEAGVLNAIARGGGIKIVADKGYIDPNGCDNFGIFIAKRLDGQVSLDDPESLRGLQVSTPPASWLDFVWQQIVAPLGLTGEDFVNNNMPTPNQVEASEQGTLDIILNNEPWTTRFRQAGLVDFGPKLTEFMPGATFAITFYGPTLVDERPEVGKRFMVAYLKAVRQYNEGPSDRNVEIMAPILKLDPELLRAMCWPPINPTGAINVESILAYEEWAQRVGYLDAVVPAEEFWDGSFVEFANQELGAP